MDSKAADSGREEKAEVVTEAGLGCEKWRAVYQAAPLRQSRRAGAAARITWRVMGYPEPLFKIGQIQKKRKKTKTGGYPARNFSINLPGNAASHSNKNTKHEMSICKIKQKLRLIGQQTYG